MKIADIRTSFHILLWIRASIPAKTPPVRFWYSNRRSFGEKKTLKPLAEILIMSHFSVSHQALFL